MSVGVLTIGNLTLSERYTITDATNAQSGMRTVNLSGVETQPPLSVEAIRALAEDLTSIYGQTLPVIFSQKDDRNGYYTINDVNTGALHWEDHAGSLNWSLALTRVGPDNAVDVESRLANVVRSNDFSLVGERWHAPAIGSYGYRTGTTQPVPISRPAENGTVTVYLGIPADENPRWGCPVDSFGDGRVKLFLDGRERVGTNIRASGAGWEINNGLIKVGPISGALIVSSFVGGAWQRKDWSVFNTSGTLISLWDSMTVLRNDNEVTTIRLVESTSTGIGATYLDLTLRRGSRFVEGYMQRSVSSDEMKILLDIPEAFTDNTSYVLAAANDAAGNQFIAGSAREFTPHANGGLVRLNTTVFDFFVGLVAGGTAATSGEQAADLMDQYIAVQAETTMVVPR